MRLKAYARPLAALAASVLCCNALVACRGSGQGAGAHLTAVNFSYVGAVPFFAPLMYAGQHPDECTKYGVKVTTANVDGSTATGGLANGSIDMLVQGNGSFMLAAKGSPGKTVAVAAIGPTPLVIYGAKGINTIDALRGKSMAVTSEGAITDVSMHLIADYLHTTSGHGLGRIVAGSATAQLGLAATGKIAAFTITPPIPASIEARGVHRIGDMSDIPGYTSLAVDPVVANKKFLTDHPKAVHGALQCLSDANAKLQGKDAAVAALTKGLGIDETAAGAGYEGNKAGWTLFPYLKKYGTDLTKSLDRWGMAPGIGNFDVASVIDGTAIKGVSGLQPNPKEGSQG